MPAHTTAPPARHPCTASSRPQRPTHALTLKVDLDPALAPTNEYTTTIISSPSCSEIVQLRRSGCFVSPSNESENDVIEFCRRNARLPRLRQRQPKMTQRSERKQKLPLNRRRDARQLLKKKPRTTVATGIHLVELLVKRTLCWMLIDGIWRLSIHHRVTAFANACCDGLFCCVFCLNFVFLSMFCVFLRSECFP